MQKAIVEEIRRNPKPYVDAINAQVQLCNINFKDCGDIFKSVHTAYTNRLRHERMLLSQKHGLTGPEMDVVQALVLERNVALLQKKLEERKAIAQKHPKGLIRLEKCAAVAEQIDQIDKILGV